MRKADQERYDFYLTKLRDLSWNAYTALMASERDKPQGEQHAAMDDPQFVRACSAFERHMCPFGGGKGGTPKALRWNDSTGTYEI